MIEGLILKLVNAFIVNDLISESEADKSVEGSSSNGYYATGYIECKPYHYANIRLIEKATDKIIKETGRQYGYNKVTVTTGKAKGYESKSKLYAAIYYGWK
jgi:hypothetical protein